MRFAPLRKLILLFTCVAALNSKRKYCPKSISIYYDTGVFVTPKWDANCTAGEEGLVGEIIDEYFDRALLSLKRVKYAKTKVCKKNKAKKYKSFLKRINEAQQRNHYRIALRSERNKVKYLNGKEGNARNNNKRNTEKKNNGEERNSKTHFLSKIKNKIEHGKQRFKHLATKARKELKARRKRRQSRAKKRRMRRDRRKMNRSKARARAAKKIARAAKKIASAAKKMRRKRRKTKRDRRRSRRNNRKKVRRQRRKKKRKRIIRRRVRPRRNSRGRGRRRSRLRLFGRRLTENLDIISLQQQEEMIFLERPSGGGGGGESFFLPTEHRRLRFDRFIYRGSGRCRLCTRDDFDKRRFLQIMGNETIDNEAIGNETIDDETIEYETMGNETIDYEGMGNETMEYQTMGNETVGNETVSNENNVPVFKNKSFRTRAENRAEQVLKRALKENLPKDHCLEDNIGMVTVVVDFINDRDSSNAKC